MTIPTGKVRKIGVYSRTIPVAPKSLPSSLITLLNCALRSSFLPSETSQTQKNKFCTISPKLVEAENRMVVARDRMEGEWGGVDQMVQSFSYTK